MPSRFAPHSPSIAEATRTAVAEGVRLHGPSAVGLILHGAALIVVVWLWAVVPVLAYLLGAPSPIVGGLLACGPLASAGRYLAARKALSEVDGGEAT